MTSHFFKDQNWAILAKTFAYLRCCKLFKLHNSSIQMEFWSRVGVDQEFAGFLELE